MRLHNGDHGYGAVTKLLHWLTVAAIACQFVVGYAMDFDDAVDAEEDRLDAEADRLEDEAKDEGDAAEDRAEAEIEAREDALDAREDGEASSVFSDVVTGDGWGDGVSLPEIHVSVGLVIIALGVLRLAWRRTPLPPWAEHLGPGERRLEARLETVLLTLLLVVPATGLLLVAAGGDWLAVHVAAQVAFLLAIAAHVGLVLSHTVVRRNRHLARML